MSLLSGFHFFPHCALPLGKCPLSSFLSFWGGEEELRVESEGKAPRSFTRRPQAALVPSPHASAPEECGSGQSMGLQGLSGLCRGS